jgi:phosphoribosylformylglycinamidine synthase
LLLGGLGTSDEVHFGGTQYVKAVLNDLWGLPPVLDMAYEKRVQTAAREIAVDHLAESAHDLSGGGFAVALAESCFGPARVGAAIQLDTALRPELALFHEGPSRVLISTNHPEAVKMVAHKHGVEIVEIGRTQEKRLTIENRGTPLVRIGVDDLHSKWETALPLKLGSVHA